MEEFDYVIVGAGEYLNIRSSAESWIIGREGFMGFKLKRA